ncbi:MAG: bacteriohemerythrin [Spirochaetes bacterium]|nr:bacteriohemerythrin [Spirochaetota bacterium]
MNFIEWNDSLSVGVEVFDKEHKQLVSLVNKLNSALAAGSAKKTMEDILQSLVRYTQIHFKHEEEYMLLYDYPEYTHHKKEHEDLTAQVLDFHERYRSGKVSFSLELMKFLKDWLTNHILGSDMKYKNFFSAKGV